MIQRTEAGFIKQAGSQQLLGGQFFGIFGKLRGFDEFLYIAIHDRVEIIHGKADPGGR